MASFGVGPEAKNIKPRVGDLFGIGVTKVVETYSVVSSSSRREGFQLSTR